MKSAAIRFLPPSSLDELRTAIRRLRASNWDDDLRQGALGRAVALAAGSRAGEPRMIARAIVSLLALRGAEAVELQASIGERVEELIERLRAG